MSLFNSLKLFLEIPLLSMSFYCDNRAAEAKVKINSNNRLRHITDIMAVYVKECVRENLEKVYWVPSKEQIADMFTKPLALEIHNNWTSQILKFDIQTCGK